VAGLKARVEELESELLHASVRANEQIDFLHDASVQLDKLRSTQRTGVEQAAVELADYVVTLYGDLSCDGQREHLIAAYERAREAAKGSGT
jgi:hypothetical protein